MSGINLFQFQTYKAAMKLLLRGKGQRGALSRAAEALGCQRSFLSRVMNAEVHLTPDQAYMLSEYWGLSELQSDYFQSLVELERASIRRYRDAIQKKIERLRKQHESLSEKIKRPLPAFHDDQHALYFSTWIWSALHFLTSAAEFQTVSKLAIRLGLSESMVASYLEQLEQMGMVRRDGQKWIYRSGQFHLPNHSAYSVLNHQNWRTRAILDSQNPVSSGIHYTNTQTISRQDLQLARERLLEFIDECKRLFDPSEPQTAIAFTCDLFEV